jgi:hypothetical protein
MKLTRVAALAAVCAAAMSVPASANHSWGGYHWATTDGVLRVTTLSAVNGPWPGHVTNALNDWDSTHLDLDSRGSSTADPKKCSPVAGKIVVCNAAYGQRQWLGIANIWLSNGHIAQATTRLNDSYFTMTRYNSDAWRQFVACQEIGHDFGLDHQDETFSNPNLGTCMDYTNDPDGGGSYGPSNEHPNAHDFAQLATIYNHKDSFNSASSATNFGIRQVGKAAPRSLPSGPAGDSAAEWGRAIHTDGLGRPDVFVKDLGGGQQMITHVFWTLETRRSDIR